MKAIYISLGSNIEPERHIRAAVHALACYQDLQLSPVYESAAVGFDGHNFYNLVAGFRSADSLAQIKAYLSQIEHDNLRERSGSKFSARTLDLDLLLYGDEIIEQNGFSLPRDEILKYAFVLKPLADLIPEQKHPITQQSYRTLWQQSQMQDQALWAIDFDFQR